MHSPYSPERLAIELQTRLGAHLSSKGYALVAHGPSGLAWRRVMSPRVILATVLLGLFALGGIVSGDIGSTVVGLLCGVGAAFLIVTRRPASLAVNFLPGLSGGTDISVIGGPDSNGAEEIVRAVGNVSAAPLAPAAASSPAAGPLWSSRTD